MRWPLLITCLSISSLGFTDILEEDSELICKDYECVIRDYLKLRDYPSAQMVCREAFLKDIDESVIDQLYIEILARSGQEKEMLKCWRDLYEKDPTAALDHDLVEKMAWGVIEKGRQSSAPMIRLFSMLAAVFSQDIQGVHLIIKELKSEHSGIRAVALQLAAMLGDEILKPVIKELFYKEKVFEVRLAAIQTVGKLRMKELKGDLEKIASSDKASFEERTVAIEALVHFHDKILPFELKTLLKSPKIVHKIIGLRLAPMADFPVDINDILPLLKESYFEVRQTALHTLGLLYFLEKDQREKLFEVAMQLKDDPNRKVQIVALWLRTLINPFGTEEAWLDFLLSSKEEERLIASALIPSLGKKGIRPLMQAFQRTDDSITKVNLAIGLIKHQKELSLATKTIIEQLQQQNSLWMWKEILGQKVIAKSDLPAASLQSPPLDVHRLCQLELLSMIALIDKEAAREGIQKFLKLRNFQVSSLAMAILLTEYSEDAANLVKPLMDDPTYANRAEACVLMALWSGDESLTKEMAKIYATSDRKRKEFLLEAFGKISGTEGLPFLINCLSEPYPTLRMIAASSIIQCLNH